MPIVERTPRQCFDRFADHIRSLIAKTVTETYQVFVLPKADKPVARMQLSGHGRKAMPIHTRYGPLYFHLAQDLEATQESRNSYRLRTLRYWYRLQEAPSLTTQALLRWEYDTDTPRDSHCRNHLQLPAQLGKTKLDLNKVHTPTGWLTIEELIRFLIVDLGHKPPCGDTWPDVLAESEAAFFEQFTGKRYKPSGT